MFQDDELNELKDRISQMSDRELLQIVEVEYGDYRKEAVEFAEAELAKRSIPFEKPELDADESDDEEPGDRGGYDSGCSRADCAGTGKRGATVGD